MTLVEDVFNEAFDWVIHRTARQWRWFFIVTAVTALVGYGAHWVEQQRAAERADGAQAIRDSIAVVASMRLRAEWAESQAIANLAIIAFRATSDTLSQKALRLKTVADSLRLAQVKVIMRGDTLWILDSMFVVQPRVRWLVDTDQKVISFQQDLLSRSATMYYFDIQRVRAKGDSALEDQSKLLFISDSLLAVSRAETRQARDTLGRVRGVDRWKDRGAWIERSVIACVAYSLGARRPCWRVLLP